MNGCGAVVSMGAECTVTAPVLLSSAGFTEKLALQRHFLLLSYKGTKLSEDFEHFL